MSTGLRLEALPDLPQRAVIEAISAHIWQRYDVVALWLGGSLARGVGDIFSDIDFRVAVAPAQFPLWKTPRFEEIFAHAPVVGQQFLPFGDEAILHHLTLTNGDICDFFVQSSTKEPTPEPRLVLGCRDEQFAAALAAGQQITEGAPQAIQANVVQQLLVDFWINTHKHRKVLNRDLDLLVTFGLSNEKSLLLRLWYIDVSGSDWGDVRRQTIHTLTSVIRTLQEAVGDEALSVIGTPMRNRQEICQAIERNREVVAQVGRRLAHKYTFAYPSELEATVLQGWQEFLALR